MPILAVGPGTGRTITLGSLDFTSTSLGVRWRGMKLTGWDGAAGSTLQLAQRLTRPGAYRANTPQRTSKTLTLSGTIVGQDPASVVYAFDALNDACSLDDTQLIVDGHGVGARTMMVSQQGDVLEAPTPTLLVKSFSVQLVAADPRKFGAAQTLTTGLPSVSGGMSFPVQFPMSFNTNIVSGQVAATNPGNETGPVTIRVTGPCSGPQITHVSSGLSLVFGSSLVLGAGEYLDIDMEAQSVLAQGQVDRSQWITSRGWSGFDPGSNLWAFSAATPNPAASMAVTVTPAWK